MFRGMNTAAKLASAAPANCCTTPLSPSAPISECQTIDQHDQRGRPSHRPWMSRVTSPKIEVPETWFDRTDRPFVASNHDLHSTSIRDVLVTQVHGPWAGRVLRCSMLCPIWLRSVRRLDLICEQLTVGTAVVSHPKVER